MFCRSFIANTAPPNNNYTGRIFGHTKGHMHFTQVIAKEPFLKHKQVQTPWRCQWHCTAQDDRHWDMQERRLFGVNHVVAGINFAKYDNIEARPGRPAM